MKDEGIFGLVIGFAGLALFAVLAGLACKGVLDDVTVAVIGVDTIHTIGSWLTLIVVLVVIVAVMKVFGGSHGHSTTTVKRGLRGRHIAVHTAPHRHASPSRRVAIAAAHEAGHKAVAKARGWRVRGVEVYDDGSGVTRLYVPDSKYDPRDDIAVSLAGWKASRTRSGCSSDFGHANAAYRSMPANERAAGWHEGLQRCASALFWSSGQRSRDARKLQRDGHL